MNATPFQYPDDGAELDPDSVPVVDPRLRVVLLMLCGLEHGSLREVAARHGLGVSGLSAAGRRLSAKLGVRWTYVSDELRAKWSEGARRRCRKKTPDGDCGSSPGVGNQTAPLQELALCKSGSLSNFAALPAKHRRAEVRAMLRKQNGGAP